MISLRHPQRSPLVRLLARGLIGLLVLAGTPLEVWAYARFDPPLSSTKTPMGNRETATDDRGTTTYTYDNRNRLESLTYPDGRKLTYGYDANGNRTSLTAEVGGQVLTTTYSYDELNRLQTVTDSEGRDYVHEYDPNGNRAKLTYPNNTETSYVYDDLNRLTNLTTINTATLGMIQSYQYTLGAAGSRERIDEHDGTARVYTYDDLYRLEKETVSDSVGPVYEKSFVYDAVGNRESQTTIGTGAPGTPLAPGTIDYTYDDRDRILTEGTQLYGWDENGNLVTKDAEASYTWDFEDRLTRVEKPDGTVVTHAYDADGNRMRTTTQTAGARATVRDFLVDASGSLSHVVVQTDGAGDLAEQYVRGDDLLAVIRAANTRFFHADALGSVRRLTDETGLITDGWSYSAFGEPLGRTGTDPQPYGFAGEPYDPSIGFGYHRARWLDHQTGRFATMDPFRGRSHDPASLHRYSYAAGDPVNRIDPSGRLSLATQTVTVAGIAALASATAFAFFLHRTSTYLPSDAFQSPPGPDAAIFGFQLSLSGRELTKSGNPLAAAAGIGLFLTAGIGGFEVLVPFSKPTQAWLYGYGGIAVGFGTGSSIAGYAGFAWNVSKQGDYTGKFFCSSVTAATLVSPAFAGPPSTICASPPTDGRPGAYSGVVSLESNSEPTALSAFSFYYALPGISTDLGPPPDSSDKLTPFWERLAEYLGIPRPGVPYTK